LPNNDAQTFSDVQPIQAPQAFSDVTPIASQTAGAQPLNNAPIRTGESLYKRYAPPQSAEAVKGVIANQFPPIAATIGEMAAGPIGAAAGAAAGTLAQPALTGQKEDYGKAAENALLYGGTSKVLSMVPDAMGKLADWFGIGTKTPMQEYQAANEALGISKKQIRGPLGATDPNDFQGIPGRSVVERAGVTGAELSKMTPFEQAAKIAPAWRSAGSEVDAIADLATTHGVTFDAGKSVTQAIGKMDSPQMQDQALKVIKDTADKLGVPQDWRAATPNDVLQLRRALYDNLPARYRGPVYGAITGDLKAAVPQLGPADQAYSELRGAMDAIKSKQQAFIQKPQPSAAEQAWNAIPTPIRRALPGAALIGTGMAMPSAYDKLHALLMGQ
jgi:hypothetical protein